MNKRWRNALIIIASTIVGFYAGGGFRLQNASVAEIFVIHHSQGDDLATDISSYVIMFMFCGGAGAVAGAGLSSLTLYVLTKYKKI